MILVVGGMAAGKREYVCGRFGYTQDQLADGALDGSPVLYNLQNLVRENPAGSLSMLEVLCEKEAVICNEVGGGVIPLTPQDRAAREATGRLCNALAARATEVVRLVCGVPQVIKP